MHRLILIAFTSASAATAAFAEPSYELGAEHAGFREYYCQTRGTLTNTGDTLLQELNGFFYIMQNGEQVGRSRGASFLNVEPGASSEAVFEAPNAPCDEAVSYDFVVGACRIGDAFVNQAECASAIVVTGDIATARAP